MFTILSFLIILHVSLMEMNTRITINMPKKFIHLRKGEGLVCGLLIHSARDSTQSDILMHLYINVKPHLPHRGDVWGLDTFGSRLPRTSSRATSQSGRVLCDAGCILKFMLQFLERPLSKRLTPCPGCGRWGLTLIGARVHRSVSIS